MKTKDNKDTGDRGFTSILYVFPGFFTITNFFWQNCVGGLDGHPFGLMDFGRGDFLWIVWFILKFICFRGILGLEIDDLRGLSCLSHWSDDSDTIFWPFSSNLIQMVISQLIINKSTPQYSTNLFSHHSHFGSTALD